MNETDRNRIKAAVLKTLRNYGKPLKLPIPIKSIVKSIPNVQLVRYSTQMQRRGLSYSEMLTFAGTEDACTDFDANNNLYIIYYNDCDERKITTDRYRWNIAHELAHVVLNHHKSNPDSRLFRNRLSERTYKALEAEADMFASYILVPYIVIGCFGIQNNLDISNICRVSASASSIRFDCYKTWKRRNRAEQYDFDILNLFSQFVETSALSKRVQLWINKHRSCLNCSAAIPLSNSFCRICGKKANILYRRQRQIMKYSGIEIDGDGRALECPVCHNTDLHELGSYCVVCGNSLINQCNNSLDAGCTYNDPLPGYARYCPICGGNSTFLKRGILPTWDGKPLPDDEDGELPF